jgi:hypothetical protein
MKKIFPTTLLLSLSMLTCDLSCAEPSAPNLIENGDFETPIAELANGFGMAPGEGRGNGTALRFERTDASSYSFQVVSVIAPPGADVYRYGGWVKFDPTAGGKDARAGFVIQFEGTESKFLGGGDALAQKGEGSAGHWTYVSGVASVPAGTEKIVLIAYMPKGMTGKVWFDDMFCEEFHGPDQKVSKAGEPPVAMFGFDRGVNNWELPTGYSLMPDGVQGACLQYERTDPDFYNYHIVDKAVPTAKAYRFGAMVKIDPAAGDEATKAGIVFQFEGDGGAYLGGAEAYAQRDKGGWTEVSGVADVPEGTKHFIVIPLMPKGFTGKVCFDHVFYQEIKK